MASKPPETGEPEQAAEPTAEAPAPGAPAAEAQPDNAEADEPEAIDWGAEILALEPPEGGGACDLYPTNKAGHSLVPAGEAAALLEHGFRVASGKKA
jgi:hypothetical protein